MITNTNLLPVSELRSRYLLANTATFIVREYRDLNAVQSYADAHTAEAIAQDAMEIANGWELSANTLALFYALLVALSFKSYSDTAPHLDKFRRIKYDFLPEIVDVIGSVMSPSTTLVVDRYSNVLSPDPSSSTFGGSTHVINIAPTIEGVTL